MKKLSVIFSVLMATLLLLSMVVSCAQKAEEPVILRMNLAPPPGDPMTVECEAMAARFNERAGPQYTIQVYPGATLAAPPEMLDAVMAGNIEIGLLPLGAYGGADNRLNAIEFPFLYNNIQALEAAQGPDIVKLLNEEIFEEKFNQKMLGPFHTMFLELVSTKKPIKTMEDFDGLLVGSLSPTISAITELLGGSSAIVPWMEIAGAMEKGVVDASFQGPVWIVVGGLTDVCNYVTFTAIVPTSYGMNINLDVYNAMPKDVQEILLEEAERACFDMNKVFTGEYLKSADVFASKGLEVYTLTKEERERWHQALIPYIEENFASWGEFGKKFKAIADKANAANP